MRHLKSFNESRVYGYEILPKIALLRIYRKSDDFEFDLLWNHGDYDEVEFEEFPPKGGDLKFF